MIIDFHTHIFPDKIAARTIESLGAIAGVRAATDGTLNGLLASMEKSGIEKSVIMPVCTKPEQFENINHFAKKINDIYGGKLISFGGIHPDCENPKEKLNYIKALGIPGIKIHPDYQRVMIDDVRFMRIIEHANELGLMILTHAGIDIGLPEPVHCPPEKMRKVLDTLKPKKMILAHMGGWKQWEEVYECLAGEDVYLDTAFMFGVWDASAENREYITKEMFLKILEKHGFDKILFATDSPWSNAVKGIEYIRNLPINEKEKSMILGENAIRLLNGVF
ncbi:MAG: amidohydrolase family protein [Lachnospiraceae bacterium]|nr:amidohydrolase family protein [Lachnospiraceae bacterium]